MTLATNSSNNIYININTNNDNDDVFNEILADFTAALGKEYFKIDFLNSDNVIHYINFKDGNNRNLNTDNRILSAFHCWRFLLKNRLTPYILKLVLNNLLYSTL